MKPARVVARRTVELLLPHLPEDGGRILEVGCGQGEVAAELGIEGFEVLALDPNEEDVAAARERGVDARVRAWPEDGPDEDGFDAVLFVRSLHHMERLSASVAAARDALRPGGPLLAVEFDRTPLHPVAAAWIRGVVSLLDAVLPLEPDEDSFEGRLVAGEGPAEAWAKLHDHYDAEFPTLVQMRRALEREMSLEGEETCATLYRYPARAVPETDLGGDVVARIHAVEQELIESGRLELPGRLLVARPG